MGLFNRKKEDSKTNKIPQFTKKDRERIESVFESLKKENYPILININDIKPETVPIESNTQQPRPVYEVVQEMIRCLAIGNRAKNLLKKEEDIYEGKFLVKYGHGFLFDELEEIEKMSADELSNYIHLTDLAWSYAWLLGLCSNIPENPEKEQLFTLLDKFNDYKDLCNNCKVLDKEEWLFIAERFTLMYISSVIMYKEYERREMAEGKDAIKQILHKYVIATQYMLSFDFKH